MPLPMPKAMMTTVTAIPTSCQKILPPAVAPKLASKAATPCIWDRLPVKDWKVYLKIQPVTTE